VPRKVNRDEPQRHHLLHRISTHLEELITATSRLKSIYVENPNLAAQVSRRAKALRTALQAFQAFLNDPGKVKAAPRKKGKKRSLAMRFAFEAPYQELAPPRRPQWIARSEVLGRLHPSL